MKKTQLWLWLPIIYIILYLIGLSDEYGIFIYLVSPTLWVIYSHWFRAMFAYQVDIPTPVQLFITLVFWYIVGFLIDLLIHKLNKDKIKGV